MAANVLTTVMFAVQVAVLCFLCTPGTSAYAPYEIISRSNHVALPSDSTFLLWFETHANSRFRRQSGGDASTNSKTTGQTTPDESSQPDSTGKHSNTSSAASVTTPVSTPKGGSTDGLNEGNDTSDQQLFDDADIIHDFHNYYTSDIISNKFSDHWIELENAPKHETLSTGHRVAAIVNLMFDFYFYGHKVNNLTIATGGFLYMSPFVHQWLTATQYIAPLMANFDPSFSNESSIYVQSEKNRFIVEWKDLVLKDQNTSGRFHFQTILSQDNSIKFVYKLIPLPVMNISTDDHPVKIGLSDAYYNDSYIPVLNIKRRTIYEYHKVALPVSSVVTKTVIILTPLPTCNRLTDCDSCTKHTGVKFDCRWCSSFGRCSDGLDWYRQHWDNEGCQTSHTKDAGTCSTNSSTLKPVKVSLRPSYSNNLCLDGKCDKKSEFPVAVIVIVVIIVCGLLAGLTGWVYYAYTHPTSRSGMWLMEHRPSQIKSKIKFWKSSSDSGTKYKVETES